MTVDDHLETFAGKPVRDYDPEVGLKKPTEVAYRVRIDYDTYDGGGSIGDLFGKLFADPAVSKLEALLIGAWDFESSTDASGIVEQLVGAAKQLEGLRALFIGDITYEEQEISWIQQSDMTPLLKAFPQLEVFRARGGEGLSLGPTRHEYLRELGVEAGGLPKNVITGVAESHFPVLEKLELWLGDENYGYEGAVEALGPLFAGHRVPALRHLGLMNAEDQDVVVAALMGAKVYEQIAVLDVSMGTLGDKGAQALIDAPHTKALKKLIIHHHYLSEGMMEKLRGLGIETDIGAPEQEESDGDRYVAVAE